MTGFMRARTLLADHDRLAGPARARPGPRGYDRRWMVARLPPATRCQPVRATPARAAGEHPLARRRPAPARQPAIGRAVDSVLRSPARVDTSPGAAALADAVGTRRLARCAGGTCACGGACHPEQLRPDEELEVIRSFFRAPVSAPRRRPAAPARVLARSPAYRPRPSWSTRDASQPPEACEPLPQWLAEAKWQFWSTAFPAEAVRRCGCSEVGPVWDAYFAATGSPRFVWTEAANPQSCIIRSLKNDDDHIPFEDPILDAVRRRMPALLHHLRGQPSVTLTLAQAGVGAPLLTPALNLNTNIRVGGQLFGGVGSSEYGPDTRRVDGTVELVKEIDPGNRLWVQVRPRFTLRWHITDGVDFCPGNTGGAGAPFVLRQPLLNLSWLEASGMARDVYVEADYTRIRNDVPYGPFPNPDLIDPNPPRVVTVPGRVLFDYDSATLAPAAAEALALALGNRPSRADPSRLVEVRGHTDSRGSDAYNDRLSQQRAEAVRDFLEQRYPNLRGRVHAIGRGEREPVAPNEVDGRDNPAGRAQNRRVEIEFDALEPSTP
jgi:outer membrane protein OmpA-like peptidoglycan-associated protein